jgi:hypothetical protein
MTGWCFELKAKRVRDRQRHDLEAPRCGLATPRNMSMMLFYPLLSKYSNLATVAAIFCGFGDGDGRWRIAEGVAILW